MSFFYRHLIVLVLSDSFCLLIGMFRPLTFNVIVNRIMFKPSVLLYLFYICAVWFPFFLPSFVLSVRDGSILSPLSTYYFFFGTSSRGWKLSVTGR